jgi:hypothetical protein
MARQHRLFVIDMAAFTADGAKKLEDQGITDVIVGLRNACANEEDTQPLAETIAALPGPADSVIARVNG